MVGTQLVLSFALIWLCDWSVRHLLSNLQQSRLQRQAATDASETAQMISTLKGEISKLESDISERKRRRLRLQMSSAHWPPAIESHHAGSSELVLPPKFRSETRSTRCSDGRPLDLIQFLHDLWEITSELRSGHSSAHR